VSPGVCVVDGCLRPDPAGVFGMTDMTDRQAASQPAVGGPYLASGVRSFLDALATARGPPIYRLSPSDARQVLRATQAVEVAKPAADLQDRTVPGGPDGQVSVRIARPRGASGTLPAVMYFHGGGSVLGDSDTHDRLVRQIAVGARVAVVFVNYTPRRRRTTRRPSSRPTRPLAGSPSRAPAPALTPHA
jgi:hypothetical protein